MSYLRIFTSSPKNLLYLKKRRMKTTDAMNLTKGESELKKMEAIFGLLKPFD